MESTLNNKTVGMESLTELYRIGFGPSSSHTMGPELAVSLFSQKNPTADRFKVMLYGSLSKTGKGHGTDVVIKKTLAPKQVDVEFLDGENLPHPNTMDVLAIQGDRVVDSTRVISVGGGKIKFDNSPLGTMPIVYPHASFADIKSYCIKNNLRLSEYAVKIEGDFIRQYALRCWEQMKQAVTQGIKAEGILPGGLNVARKAKTLFTTSKENEPPEVKESRLVCAYAFAVSEQNAAYEKIVTAPTCGAAGVVPAILYYHQQKNSYTDEQIVNALLAGGIIGNLIKTNASISGAECGCQAEVGTACAMAAAALSELLGRSLDDIEYAAEIAIEHHLGLTCDPICGLVQIPCIERNAVAAIRAINAVTLSGFLSDTRKISFDKVVKAMKETGHDMSTRYKETSEGGLAKIKIS